MSDPVTNIEIEDVLSSIRRLVSEEARNAAPEPVAQALILTPDARIHDGRLADAQDLREVSKSQDPAAPLPDADESGAKGRQGDAAQDDMAQADTEKADTAEAETSDGEIAGGQPQEAPKAEHVETSVAALFAAPEQAEAAEPAAEDAAPMAVDVPQAEVEPVVTQLEVEAAEPLSSQPAQTVAGPAHDSEDAPAPASQEGQEAASRATLEQTIADLEAAVSDTDAEWEPDGEAGHENSPSDTAPPASLWEDVVVRDAFKPAFKTPVQTDAPHASEAIGAAAEQVAVDAAMDALAQEMDTHWEMHGTGAERPMEDVLGTPSSGLPDADAEADAFEASVLKETMAAAGVSAGREDAVDTIDEEALRGLIVGIVREELQGALGERITRNVRKLVRREIYRALNSDDLS